MFVGAGAGAGAGSGAETEGVPDARGIVGASAVDVGGGVSPRDMAGNQHTDQSGLTGHRETGALREAAGQFAPTPIGAASQSEPVAFEGWCPDCDLPSAVVEIGADGSGWASCMECEHGWVWRDDAVGVPLQGWRAEREPASSAA